MLKWYLNIGLFLATMYWVEYLILPTQTTNEKVLSVYEEDFVKYKTETGIKFTMDMHYLKKGDYVDLSFSPILKQVKRIEIKGAFNFSLS